MKRATKSKIVEADKFSAARILEQEGDINQAIKTYRALVSRNPLHTGAINRMLILLRRLKKRQAEIDLLESAISKRLKELKRVQQDWVKEHAELAERSRPLAKLLGLLNEQELPNMADKQVNTWSARLERLTHKTKPRHAKKSKSKMEVKAAESLR